MTTTKKYNYEVGQIYRLECGAVAKVVGLISIGTLVARLKIIRWDDVDKTKEWREMATHGYPRRWQPHWEGGTFDWHENGHVDVNVYGNPLNIHHEVLQ